MPSGVYKRSKENINSIKNNGIKGRFKKGHKRNLGSRRSESTKAKMRASQIGNPFAFKKGQHPSVKTEFKGGEENRFWRGGISFEPYNLDWTNTLRQSIRERDKYTCKICGEKQGDVAFCIHHIDYDKKNCNPENLITLCNSCHVKTNYSRDYWLNYFIN